MEKPKVEEKKGDKLPSQIEAAERRAEEMLGGEKRETKEGVEKPKVEEAGVEKEKTAEGALEMAREDFARADLAAKRWFKGDNKSKTMADFEKDGGNSWKEYAGGKGKYFEALKIQRAKMLEDGTKKIEALNLPKEKKDKEMKKLLSEIVKETVARESGRLHDKKAELGLELKGGEGKFEKILNVSKKVVEKYRKMPLKYKLLLSAGLLAGGVAAGAVGGAAGAAMVTGVVAGRWFQRVLGGSAAAVGIEALWKRKQEKKAEKEISAEFADKLMDSIKSGDKKIDEKLLKLEGGKKREKYRRFALAGSVGALIMSGWTAKAFGAVIPDEWGDWMKNKVGLGAEAEVVPEAEEVGAGAKPTAGILPEGQKEALERAKIWKGAPEIPETEVEGVGQAEVAPSGGFVEVAGKGDSVWKMAEDQLEKHYGERFSDLDPAQKTYAIDAIKDKIAADPGKFGLEDIDKIKVGDKVDFSSIFESEGNIDDMFNEAEELKQAALENIAKNNQILEDWVKEHPGEELSSEKVEEILTGKEAEIKGLTGQDVRLKGNVTNIELGGTVDSTIKALGFNPDEYNAIKGATVGKLFEEIPSKEQAWENFGPKGKGIDLPHDGIYGASEFNKHIKLAEFIRSFEPGAGVKKMTVDQFLGIARP